MLCICVPLESLRTSGTPKSAVLEHSIAVPLPVNPSMLVPRLLTTNYYNVNFEKPKYFWVLMNVFPAVVNATKFQEQQKTFVIHYFVVIQHTLAGSLHGGQTRHSCEHIGMMVPSQKLIYGGWS